MQTFTDENFKGYEFRCTTESANTGFKHVCSAFKDGQEIEGTKSVVNWGNRTWEPYQYACVLENSKDRLQNIIDGIKKPEIDFDFLNRLANEEYIYDYGEMEDGEVVILMESWNQVEGYKKYNEETKEWVVTEKSVYAKLRDLAERKLLKPSVQYTIDNVEFAFTDEYRKCDECGIIHNTYYGDLTYVEEEDMLLCDNCINSPDRVEALIEKAKEDMRQALKPTVNQDIIEKLGYTLVTEETFSFEKEFWGATYVTEDFVDNFIHDFNGFVQIYEVAQFVTPFQIWIPNDRLEEAQKELSETFEREAI